MILLLNATLGETLNKLLYIIIALVALMIMIVIHELGHYTAGKLFKFKIKEFAIGFGRPLYKRKGKSGEIFSVRMLPLGGFCAFYGEDEENAEEGAFNSKPCWQRIIVLVSGVLFNFIFSMLILGIFFIAYGYSLPVVNKAYNNTALTQTLKEGDILYKINGKKVYTVGASNVSKLIGGGDSAIFEIYRDGKLIEIEGIKSEYAYENEDGSFTVSEGYGISLGYTQFRFNFFECLWRGMLVSFQIIGLIFSTIGQLFTGVLGLKGSLGGPITTIGLIGSQVQEYGFMAFVNLLGVMSASIAFMNILPIPALDGSRVVFVVIEWIRGKPIDRKLEGTIHFVGFIVLISLTILLDIVNFS